LGDEALAGCGLDNLIDVVGVHCGGEGGDVGSGLAGFGGSVEEADEVFDGDGFAEGALAEGFGDEPVAW